MKLFNKIKDHIGKWLAKYQFIESEHYKHENKLDELRKEHVKLPKAPKTAFRFLWVIVAGIISLGLAYEPNIIVMLGNWVGESTGLWANKTAVTTSSTISGYSKLSLIALPVAVVLWAFRDANRLRELENSRKDTNLKEFQQLQRWATGNMEHALGNENSTLQNSESTQTALQISALHLLRAYLKGEYGDNFRRGAYEIFASALESTHQRLLNEIKAHQGIEDRITQGTVLAAIEADPLAKQLNRIAAEDWFHLIVNHEFPTATLSLMGVNLAEKYLAQTNLNKANLRGAYLYSADLQGAYLYNADLQGAYLPGANFQGADLTNANLQSADLIGAKMQGAKIKEADLLGANLFGANLLGANLSDAKLQGAYLSKSSWQGAKLFGTKMQGANSKDENSLPFTERMRQRVGCDAELNGIDESLLSNNDKNQLIAQLQQIADSIKATAEGRDTNHITEAIKRIKAATTPIDTTDANLGSYSKAEAEQWIKEYNEAMKESVKKS